MPRKYNSGGKRLKNSYIKYMEWAETHNIAREGYENLTLNEFKMIYESSDIDRSLMSLKDYVGNLTKASTVKAIQNKHKFEGVERLQRSRETTTQWLERIGGTENGKAFINELNSEYRRIRDEMRAKGMPDAGKGAKRLISQMYFGSD